MNKKKSVEEKRESEKQIRETAAANAEMVVMTVTALDGGQFKLETHLPHDVTEQVLHMLFLNWVRKNAQDRAIEAMRQNKGVVLSPHTGQPANG